jgi:Ca2+-binding EF-hand superfamily protein
MTRDELNSRGQLGAKAI